MAADELDALALVWREQREHGWKADGAIDADAIVDIPGQVRTAPTCAESLNFAENRSN